MKRQYIGDLLAPFWIMADVFGILKDFDIFFTDRSCLLST